MALGQATTAQLTGTVTTEGKTLQGVTVTVSSPAMQGTRTTVSGANGDYLFPALPPGRYNVRFELEGMQTITRKAELKLAETARVDSDLKVSKVAESITVTATSPSVLETPQVSTNLDAKLVEQLPVGRRIQDRVQLAPGVTSAGTNGQTVINGAQSFDNLYLVNGVVINENVRGQPQNAVIEEAIQETTLLTGGVSAEYGRFTGGVVSTITKSGGNELSGSFRDNLTNDNWIAKSGLANESNHIDKLNNAYEATFGGRIITDKLWFFGASGKENSSTSNQTVGLLIPYSTARDQKRYEGKLTGNITSRHTLVGSYLEVDDTLANSSFGNIVDEASLRSVGNPIKLYSVQYHGTLTNNFLLEALYSKKDFSIIGGGASSRDRVFGTLLRDIATGWRAWSPTFCGVCEPKERDNKDWSAKGHYFLATPHMGSHNLVAGYDEFHELRNENNYQSGSDFRFFGDFILEDGKVYVHADPNLSSSGVTRSRIQWDPLLGLSKTSDFATKSLFVNDKWDFNSNWNFTLGARYDKIDGENQAKVKTVDASRVSPRLGVIYDVKADGRNRLSFTYGRYAAKIDQGAADATATGGRYATYLFQYKGPEINKDPNGVLVPTDQVLQQVFAWFAANGDADPNNPLVFSAAVPGLNVRIDKPLEAPIMDEVTFGYGMPIATNGYIRADLVHRDWSDFYVLRRDLSTGKVNNGKLDLGLIENGGSGFDRKYNALLLQGNYKLLGRVTLGGNYTYATLEGNVEGEEFNNATVPVGLIQPGGNEVYETPNYPEYTGFSQNRPTGYLSEDIRHKANVWLQIDAPIPFGTLNVGLLQRYHSGVPYSAAAAINPQGVTNPGYAKPPTSVQYYFSKRGAFRLDDILQTDVNVTYTIPITKVSLFVKGDVLNALNRHGVENVEGTSFERAAASASGPVIDKSVRTSLNTPNLLPFNPFTDTPKECPQGTALADCKAMGANYQLSSTFGNPTNRDAYQLPRTYRVAVGVRF
jgi:outer membrane receptor protein involved in Fe transport